MKIYPDFAFEEKNAFGNCVHVTKKSILSDYLDEMFMKIKSLLLSDTISCISIILKNNSKIIEKFDLKIDKSIALKVLEHFPSQFERDIYFKKIIIETVDVVKKRYFWFLKYS